MQGRLVQEVWVGKVGDRMLIRGVGRSPTRERKMLKLPRLEPLTPSTKCSLERS